MFRSGSASARVQSVHIESKRGKRLMIGALTQEFSLDNLLGKRLRFTAWVRTENARSAYIALRLDNTAPFGPKTSYYDSRRSAPVGTSPWTRHEVQVDIPSESVRASAALILFDAGTMWIDDAAMDVLPPTGPIAPPQPVSAAVNLDFEP